MMQIRLKILFLVFGLISFLTACSQTKNQIWHKQVYRVIDMAAYEDTARRLNSNTDTSLMEMISDAVSTGRLNAGVSKRQFQTYTDTDIVEDYDTHKVDTVLRQHFFNPRSVNKYQLLEDWTFDPLNGSTVIEIVSIGPFLHFDADACKYCNNPEFTLPYHDFRDIIQRHDQRYPTHAFSKALLDNYFSYDSLHKYTEKKNKDRIRATASRKISHPYPYRNDTIFYLQEKDRDTTFLETLLYALDAGKMVIYNPDDSSYGLTMNLGDVFTRICGCDWDIIIDPLTNEPRENHFRWNQYSETVSEFRLLEDWEIDQESGKTTVQITDLIPMRKYDYYEGLPFFGKKPIFRLQYKDIKELISAYARHHADDNISLNIWKNYFYSNIKPTRINEPVSYKKK